MDFLIRSVCVVICVFAIVSADSPAVVTRYQRSANTCGVSKGPSGFIVRGQGFERGDFPWIVALMQSKTPPISYFCGGTLISATFVVSAAHCILQKNSFEMLLPRHVHALFGAHDLSNPYEPEKISLSPKRITIHEDWNPHVTEYDADISLLEFEKGKILFTDDSLFIRPICLWEAEHEAEAPEGIVTGWGKSEDPTKFHETEPKLIKVTIQTNEQCFFGAKPLIDLSSFRTFCAGLRNGSGVCFGDSGGGLFMKVDGVYFLKGIVSSSLVKADGCDVSRNAVYTNVSKFKDWIDEKTRVIKKVFCNLENLPRTCQIDQAIISSELFAIGSDVDVTTEYLNLRDNKKVKFLPRGIGERFPNIVEANFSNCSLSIVRDFYFDGLRKVEDISLSSNKIATIEPGAFKDLVKMQYLFVSYNRIETLDENLFVSMVNLRWIGLNGNRIKTLSPTTFRVQLRNEKFYIDLTKNVCIDREYESSDLQHLVPDISKNCTQKKSQSDDRIIFSQ